MKKGIFIGLGIFLTILTLNGVLVLHAYNQMRWHVHEPMTSEQQVRLSSMGLIPYVAGSLERYADRGLRDSEYMAESFAFGSPDELAKAVNGISADMIEKAFEYGGKKTEDIKGVPVTVYGLPGMRQASKDELDPEYEYYFYGCDIQYYILEYEDGTYRFAVDIHNM